MNGVSLWTLYTVKFERAESISLHVILGSLFLVSGFVSIVKVMGICFWFGSFRSLQLKHHSLGDNLDDQYELTMYRKKSLSRCTVA